MSVRLLLPPSRSSAPCLVARSADEENPYKNAKVGDYATYKMTMKVAGLDIAGTSTQKRHRQVREGSHRQDDRRDRVHGEQDGDPRPGAEDRPDQAVRPDEGRRRRCRPGTDAKVEKGKEGKEKIKVGGKEYDAPGRFTRSRARPASQDITADVKAWMSKELPAGHGQDGDDRRRRRAEDGDDDGTDRDRQQEVGAANDYSPRAAGFFPADLRSICEFAWDKTGRSQSSLAALFRQIHHLLHAVRPARQRTSETAFPCIYPPPRPHAV